MGLADAKRPSTGAGSQKALTAIPTLMAVGLETILQAGPGGQFVDKVHTARHLRRQNAYWEPSIWSRELLRPWLQGAQDTDVDRARDVVMAARHRGERPGRMSAALERAVLDIIERAGRELL